MKMKKNSLFAICIAAMLIVGVTTTFATSAAGSDRESNTVQGTDVVTVQVHGKILLGNINIDPFHSFITFICPFQ